MPGQGKNQRGGGGGRGQGGVCVCAKCGHEQPHQRGVPCMDLRCPECNAVMFRKGGEHYQRAMEKKSD